MCCEGQLQVDSVTKRQGKLAVRLCLALVHRLRPKDHSREQFDQLRGEADLYLVRGEGNRSAANGRCGEGQGAAGRRVQAVGQQRVRKADRGAGAADKHHLQSGRRRSDREVAFWLPQHLDKIGDSYEVSCRKAKDQNRAAFPGRNSCVPDGKAARLGVLLRFLGPFRGSIRH